MLKKDALRDATKDAELNYQNVLRCFLNLDFRKFDE